MQATHSSVIRLRLCAKLATMLLIACGLFVAYAQAPAKYANDTFTLISRGDHGRVRIHLKGEGDHCWASSSYDNGIAISMGDDLCTSNAVDVPDNALVFARVMPNKISFRLQGKSYSISDANTVKSARSLFDPLVSIEAQQDELGARQRALGERQRELGHSQSQVKVSVPDMSADFQKVEADAKRLSSQGANQSELGDLQSELGDLQSRIGDLQSQAGDQESKLGDQQSNLGEQQERDQQSELAEKGQAIIVNIADKLHEILKQAVNAGTAKPE